MIVRNAIQDFDERMDAIGQELVHNSTPPFSLADLALSGPSRLPDRLDNGEPVAHHEVLPCPLFHAALLDGSLEMGYASWNRVAIRFIPAGEVVEAVASETGGRALKVYARDGEIIEEDIPCRLLEESVHSHSVST